MKRFCIVAILMALCTGTLSAQDDSDYMFQIKVSKKVINVDELEMPGNTTVYEALEVMPELLGRDFYDILDNYDVQLDDKSIMAGREAALRQIHLYDVHQIEISKSPSASSQKKGQGGVVNIKLKDSQAGFKGEVVLNASTQWDVMPAFQCSYKTDKFSMFGWFSMEYYHPRNDNEYSETTNGWMIKMSSDTTTENYAVQSARLYMKYKPTDADVLKFWFTEGLGIDDDVTTKTSVGSRSGTSFSRRYEDWSNYRKFELSVGAEYEHTFTDKSIFDTELNVNYTPLMNLNCLNEQEGSSWSRPSDINGLAKYKQNFKTREGNKSTLTGGLNYSFASNVEDFNELRTIGNTLYLSPYVEYEAKFGNWEMLYSARYQYNLYSVKEGSESVFVRPMNNITGDIKIGWQFRPHQNLRLNLQRTIAKPSYYQMYPYLVYRPQQGKQVLGNSRLNSVPTYTAGINYIFDHDFAHSTLVLDAGIDYRYSNGIILTVPLLSSSTPTVTYENGGELHNVCLDLMAFYKYSYFSIGLTANGFSNFENWNSEKSQYAYYNLSLTPALDFSQDWNLSMRLTYYSRVETGYSYLGDAFDGRIRLTKIWRNLDAHIQFSDIFHDETKDTIYDGDVVTTRYYDLIKRAFELGVTVKF